MANVRSVSWPRGLAAVVDEVIQDYEGRGGLSRFLQDAARAYVHAKRSSEGRAPLDDEVGAEVLREQARLEKEQARKLRESAERKETRIEEFLRDVEARKAAGLATRRFTDPEELVRYYKPTLSDSANERRGQLTALAEDHGFDPRVVYRAYARIFVAPSQSQFQQRPGGK